MIQEKKKKKEKCMLLPVTLHNTFNILLNTYKNVIQ